MTRNTRNLVGRGTEKYELGRYIDGVMHYLAPDGAFVVNRDEATKVSSSKACSELTRLRKENTTIGRYAWIVLKAGEAGQVSERVLLSPKRRHIV